MKKRALISVSDKTGVLEFAKGLAAQGYEIVSTGGTYELLKPIGAVNISEVTGFPEIMDGRVKTLHPAIHGGLLAVRDNPAHMETIQAHGINTIDIVAVNLYPFKETIQKAGVTREEAIENIDIGGPSMIRSAAKNHASVAVIVEPTDYEKVLQELSAGGVTTQTKQDLAAKAFRHTAAYDAVIASYFTKEPYPEKLTLTYEIKQPLRYGENPHQQAALYADPIPGDTIIAAKQLHGKELSYNNIADADVTLAMVKEFDMPAAVAVKHQNPCGVGIGETIAEAYSRAYEADPVSIFGGIVALNREVCAKSAAQMSEIFLEIIIAPSFSQEALEILTKKKNLRLLQIDTTKPETSEQKISAVSGGLLIQEKDGASFDTANLTFPTKRKPTEAELKTAKFAWTCVKYVKSNGILLARDNMTVGIGPGQTNRVGAAKIAIGDAGERTKGAVLASDAFFPMPDTVELAAAAGIEVIIQTGGSIKDADSIAACDKHGIAMIFTGVRHFKH
ncbi:MAG: bifunctional phosphoribosylaminoimidazolecarboxamide formyltransferase/IMP cyclohydrolase [Defluviitaleaceae bacterium]|nr:bifunctional phosphoribosylaminoimidazolecarboxamide formyltransferase/IMP cyclohydrolase [Defluviitaleaceae bacterium]MCL2261814.1 bifunctional phosphoribosylaminoimidazolecarboxamide formyltransferase/IMP cyclohydrolase [Defluviitaleaceae bacterium]